MVFSLSKLSGMASSRLGWALVRDPDVAARMGAYIYATTIAPSAESQLRALLALRSILRQPALYFGATAERLGERWRRLREAARPGAARGYSLNESTTGAWYAWLRCPAGPPSCAQQLAAAGILANAGTDYGSSPAYARVGLGYAEPKWQLLLARLRVLFERPPAESTW